jgi:hypothetical protein
MAPGLLSALGRIYDLDTLDTRFTTPASVPYRAAAAEARAARESAAANGPDGSSGWSGSGAAAAAAQAGGNGVVHTGDMKAAGRRAPPSRWNTPEFWLYYVVFLTLVPYMFWIAYDVSRRESCVRQGREARRVGPVGTEELTNVGAVA